MYIGVYETRETFRKLMQVCPAAAAGRRLRTARRLRARSLLRSLLCCGPGCWPPSRMAPRHTTRHAATRLPLPQGVKEIIADPTKRNTNAVYKFETFTAANKPHGAAKAQAEEQEETSAQDEGRPHGRRSLLRRLRAN
jgi:hypothetical protein